LVSAILFIAVVAILRVVGQQALAKMSGYDLVVMVTIGSILASVALSREMTVVDALSALVTLIALQEGTRWVQARWLPFHHAVREPPRVVLWDGRLIDAQMRAASVSGDEIRAAVRRAGLSSLSQAMIIVLENDGEWSVVPKRQQHTDNSALYGLEIPNWADRADGASSRDAASPWRVP
jgi:uncharacterized membrane protein YcaP (DUF421 family)